MAKITINNISSGFASTTALNTNFNAIQTELNDKVLYRNNPTGEPNLMYQDLDMNGNRILNILATSGEGFLWKGQWTTSTSYVLNNLVFQSGSAYICKVNHTSGTFSTDLSASKWQLFAQQGNPGAGTGDMLAANNLSELTSTAATARVNISAAKSGANSDITSLSSLSTPLDVVQGGTGKNTLTANGILLGAGTSQVVPLATGNTGDILKANGAGFNPSWTSVINAITPYDGTGSGLDADMLDGQHASAFAAVGHTHTGTYVSIDANFGVGSFAMGSSTLGVLNPGATIAGSNLYTAGIANDSNGFLANSGITIYGTLTGTWRCLGYHPAGPGIRGMTLFQRIA